MPTNYPLKKTYGNVSMRNRVASVLCPWFQSVFHLCGHPAVPAQVCCLPARPMGNHVCPTLGSKILIPLATQHIMSTETQRRKYLPNDPIKRFPEGLVSDSACESGAVGDGPPWPPWPPLPSSESPCES